MAEVYGGTGTTATTSQVGDGGAGVSNDIAPSRPGHTQAAEVAARKTQVQVVVLVLAMAQETQLQVQAQVQTQVLVVAAEDVVLHLAVPAVQAWLFLDTNIKIRSDYEHL